MYTDLEVEAIYEKFLHKKIPDQSSNFAENETLPVVANGEVKPLKSIFKILDLDMERLGLPKKLGFMRVIFYSWQLSPKFELEIMTGQEILQSIPTSYRAMMFGFSEFKTTCQKLKKILRD